MSEPLNPHYQKLIRQLGDSKDSIFEPSRVIDFYPERLQAKVYGTRSKETKENVNVLFPSFFMNSGMIMFPPNDTIGLMFAGPDNERYFFPAQFFIPTKQVENNLTHTNSAPGQFDFLLGLENIEPGEILLRALKQAQIFISNNDEIELLTKNLHRLSLNGVDGSLEHVVEQLRYYLGYSYWFRGPHEAYEEEEKDLPEQHEFNMIHTEVPDWEQELVDEGEALAYSTKEANLEGKLLDKYWTKNKHKLFEQRINVYKEMLDEEGSILRGQFTSQKVKSEVDGADLFVQQELFGTAEGDEIKNTRLRVRSTYSQEGAFTYHHEKEEKKQTQHITNDVNHTSYRVEDEKKETSTVINIEPGQEIAIYQNGEAQTTVTLIGSEAHINCGHSSILLSNGTAYFYTGQHEKRYSVAQIVERVNHLSALHLIPPLGSV